MERICKNIELTIKEIAMAAKMLGDAIYSVQVISTGKLLIPGFNCFLPLVKDLYPGYALFTPLTPSRSKDGKLPFGFSAASKPNKELLLHPSEIFFIVLITYINASRYRCC